MRNKSELRDFGVGAGLAVGIVFGLWIPWLWNISYPTWPWFAMIFFIGVGVMMPLLLSRIHSLWMRFAFALGWLNTRILLGLAFFLMIFPLAMILRAIQRDPLARKLNPSVESYRVAATTRDDHSHFERPF